MLFDGSQCDESQFDGSQFEVGSCKSLGDRRAARASAGVRSERISRNQYRTVLNSVFSEQPEKRGGSRVPKRKGSDRTIQLFNPFAAGRTVGGGAVHFGFEPLLRVSLLADAFADFSLSLCQLMNLNHSPFDLQRFVSIQNSKLKSYSLRGLIARARLICRRASHPPSNRLSSFFVSSSPYMRHICDPGNFEKEAALKCSN